MNRRTAQLLDRLSAARPAEADSTRDLAGDAARRRIVNAILASQPEATPGAGSRPAAPARRPAARFPLRVALAGVALAVATAVVVGLVPGSGPGSPAPASAFELLATVAAAQPDPQPGPGQGWHVRERRWVQFPDQARQLDSDMDWWYGPDGSVSYRTNDERFFGTYPPKPRGPGAVIRTPAPRKPGPGELTLEQLRALPTDPVALKRRLSEIASAASGRAYGPDDPFIFEYWAEHYLTRPGLRPAQRAAMFRVMATYPGARSLANAEDGIGRTGIGVVIPGNILWVFDPKTSNVLGYRWSVTMYGPDGHQRSGPTWTVFDNRAVETIPTPQVDCFYDKRDGKVTCPLP
jgi:hypothetical protein